MTAFTHFVLAANEPYGLFSAATIRSLCMTASVPSRVVVHVLTTGFKRHTADTIHRAAYENGARLYFHDVCLDAISSLPTLPHISLDTYSRILAPDILAELDRFVYLDSDLVVCEDLYPLHDASLDGNAVGGVVHRNTSFAADFAGRFGLEAHPPYVNAGVLVIDAQHWRRERATGRMIEWMRANERRLLFSDQDALNHFFLGRIKELPLRLNLEARHYIDSLNGRVFDADMQQALASPAIIHFTGPHKPWVFEAYVPCRDRYLHHLEAVLVGAGLPLVRRARMLRNAMHLAFEIVRFRTGAVRRQVMQRSFSKSPAPT